MPLFKAMTEGVVELYDRYSEIISKIVLIYKKQNVEQAESFQAKIAMFEAKYYNIKAIMATVIRAEGSGSNKLGLTSPTHVSGAGMSRIALPKLNLVKFNGDLKAWQSFYDIFEASIHNSIKISDVEKFMYLRSCLKGEPLSLVSSLPLAGANYSVAWDSLKSRYNQPPLLTNAYLEALLGLRPVERAPEQLRTFTTLLIEYTGALSALGYCVEDWSVLPLFLLRKKLSSDLRERWEKEVSEEGLVTVKCFISFLKKEDKILEAAKCGPSKGGSSGLRMSRMQTKKRFKSYGAGTSALVTSTDAYRTPASPKCVLFGSNHPLFSCGNSRVLPKMIDDRRKINAFA
ncbi:hypothetical protein J437_LFUL009397 [Ladona fulva]|uniref:Gag protein n=1 Tax=Ladona fulva TaxID=123851 RepID=A0A8K0K5F4_LADFU|nr:hypothetical protein J437_LFUL009397 [Ladona fulva]